MKHINLITSITAISLLYVNNTYSTPTETKKQTDSQNIELTANISINDIANKENTYCILEDDLDKPYSKKHRPKINRKNKFPGSIKYTLSGNLQSLSSNYEEIIKQYKKTQKKGNYNLRSPKYENNNRKLTKTSKHIKYYDPR